MTNEPIRFRPVSLALRRIKGIVQSPRSKVQSLSGRQMSEIELVAFPRLPFA
jgi:hypothetical protein